MGSCFPDSHLLRKQEGRKGCNALALVYYRLSEKAIHLAFLIENFQVTNREPIPTAALDQGD
jgi:hypothetical protein